MFPVQVMISIFSAKASNHNAFFPRISQSLESSRS